MEEPTTDVDVVIIGAGAAGMMCAIETGKRGRRTIILEHNDQPGKKIRISGGGRCNFTNLNASPANYICQNTHFVKSALARFTPHDFLKLIRKYNIPYHEKKLGQLFCDNSAQDIISMLKQECRNFGVQTLTTTKALNIQKKQSFIVTTDKGNIHCASVVAASGGLSVPSLGTSDIAFTIAKHFHINTIPCTPGLVQLILSAQDLAIYKPLSGVSLDTIVSIGKTSFRENILFTHKGLSGPAILQISSYWKPRQAITVNLVPEQDMTKILEQNQRNTTTLKTFLKKFLPTRLSDTLCEHAFPNKALKDLSLKEMRFIGQTLNAFRFTPTGTEGYTKAEVTLGGIDTKELSSKTMETVKVPGLYFIGEAVDVTGHLGGYNFQWAWASGFAAGQYA